MTIKLYNYLCNFTFIYVVTTYIAAVVINLSILHGSADDCGLIMLTTSLYYLAVLKTLEFKLKK